MRRDKNGVSPMPTGYRWCNDADGALLKIER